MPTKFPNNNLWTIIDIDNCCLLPRSALIAHSIIFHCTFSFDGHFGGVSWKFLVSHRTNCSCHAWQQSACGLVRSSMRLQIWYTRKAAAASLTHEPFDTRMQRQMCEKTFTMSKGFWAILQMKYRHVKIYLCCMFESHQNLIIICIYIAFEWLLSVMTAFMYFYLALCSECLAAKFAQMRQITWMNELMGL